MAARKKAEDTVTRFKVGDDVYEVDATSLTLGETAEIEEHFGCDLHLLYSMQETLALVYTAMRRKDASLKWSDVESVSVSEIDMNVRPTKAASEAAGTPAS